MSALIFVLMLGAPPDGGILQHSVAASASANHADAKPLAGHELRVAVHEALRRWARAGDDQAEPAARDFLRLFGWLQADRQLAQASRIELALKVRGRLVELSRQLTTKAARQAPAPDGQMPKSVGPTARPVLAQFGQLGPLRPGAARQVPGAGGGILLVGDAGQELVDLIQQTLAPHTWDINGGPGTIRFWRPGHALVVYQTGEVHDQLANLVEQLEKAGR